MRRNPSFRPFASRGRRTVGAILLVFAVFSVLSVALSIRATVGAQHQASVVEVAARQRTLAERYVNELLLKRQGKQADPVYTAGLLERSAKTLLDGGEVPGVNGDDDETTLPATTDPAVRAQLEQQRLLVVDLTAAGSAFLAHRPVAHAPQTAHERITVRDPVERLRVLAALTSNVSLIAARSIAANAEDRITDLITTQVLLGVAGVLISLLLGWALIAATRRQTAHFRSLITSSTDLVLVFGDGRCRYVSQSVIGMLGRREPELLGRGITSFVHTDDRAFVEAACEHGEPHEITFRMRNRFDEWRHLEAHVTDLRGDRQVRGVVLNARDVTERVRLEDELTHQAFHDGLTSLANRALFRDRLDQALARSERSREFLAVLLVDLDGFKQVNDSLGHDAGDRLLQHVAERFARVTRPSDTLARLGGDEFALLLDGANETVAVGLTQRLLEELSAPTTVAGHELAMSASVGVVIHPGGLGSSEDLIRHADVAMYAAKEAGRGGYQVFRYEMARKFGEVLGMEHELRLGLQRGEFSVHYQPEVSLESDQIVGVEALLRWTSPTRGEVPPDEFIPVAEGTGLILPMGEFVLREACSQTAQWRNDGVLPERFTTWVNVSGRQLSAGGIDALVNDVLASVGLPAQFLGMEVTETVVVNEGAAGERARLELQELHQSGVRIAIDDFGTGVSSLGQIQRFPVDIIKVDRSFVQGVSQDAKGAAIAANVVSLAHALGLMAVAEGIETDDQLESMRNLDCDLAQGFLFARPVPPGQLRDLLVEYRRSATAGVAPTAAR
jgi:diguanylate cyclase (GGDEF)-like protein/PAS domain S-box-containing protein